MSSNRSTVIILFLIGVISALAGIFGNVAAGALPAGWQPYLWLAWPLFVLFTLAGIGLVIWQARRDPPAPPAADPPHAAPLPAPMPLPAQAAAQPAAPADGFAYDVFISYSSADKTWVRGELLDALEQAGLRVCIDFRSFQPGAPSVKEMERAVTTSRRTLLVLTPAYLASAWTEFETLMLQTLDAANRKRRLIPLLRERCDLPLHIGYLTYINFVDPDDPAWPWQQLLTALGAPPSPDPAQPPTPASWFLAHPYPMPPNFTGRVAERDMLTNWLERDPGHPLLVINALGGFGKSALAWHWLTHDVDAARWPRVVWWSFYETESTFERFLAETLAYLGVDLRQYPGPRQQADVLLQLLRRPGTLLILDGFERGLRAYASMMAVYQGDDVGQIGDLPYTDCVSPVAEHFLRSLAALPGLLGKALMTTRLTPRVLQVHGGDLLAGCREVKLEQMQPADAVAFFRSQGVRGGRAEIEAACAPYGYHPLSLRLLAGLIKTDLQQPGDIAAARRLDVSGDLVQRQHHVLAAAYESLPPGRRHLLGRLACFRGPVAYEALAAVAEQSQTADLSQKSAVFNAALRDLVDRGLLHRDARVNRFDLHPIVRRYAYDRLTRADRGAAHAQLRDYFAAIPAPEKVGTLHDLAPVIELYHHTLAAGQYDEARTLFRDRINIPTYFQFGAYQLRIELLSGLFPDGEDKPPRLKDKRDQAWTLNELANSYSLSGQPRRSVPLFQAAADMAEKQDDKKNLAVGLGNLAYMAQLPIGALQAAEATLRRSIALCREIADERQEAVGRQELGRLLAYGGRWDEAETELDTVLALFEKQHDVQAQGIVWAYRSLRALLMARDPATIGKAPSALPPARRALELADEMARTFYPVERDYVSAHWLLGAAYRASGDPSTNDASHRRSGQALDDADRHLNGALTRCRGINNVEQEAGILLDLARLRRDQARSTGSPSQDGAAGEVRHLAEEALLISERSGSVLQGADVHLFLAQLDLDAGDRVAAREHAQQARRLATCDGPPDHSYKVAYEEAGALLARLEEGR